MPIDTPSRGRPRSRPLLLVLAALAVGLGLAACSDAEAAGVREVLVDYNHDEFAGSFLGNFPHEVRVHPGMTLRFKQAWTGEPHSITGGRMVHDAMEEFVTIYEKYHGGSLADVPQDDFMRVDELIGSVPFMMGDDFPEGGISQNVAQPCYLREGGPPDDPSEPCPDDAQEQPAFDGTYDWYNSGFIGYEGTKGNRFDMPLSEDIEPGTYYFYCAVHSPFQYSKVVVVPEDEPIPTQAEVAKLARDEIENWAQPLLEAYQAAESSGDQVTFEDPFEGEKTFEKPVAGFASSNPWVHGFGSEFLPRDMTVKTGQKVTWAFIGGHTVSFEVPAYFSQMEIEDDGTVIFNPDALLPVNSPSPPEPPEPPPGEEGQEGPEGEEGPEGQDGGEGGPPPGPPPPAIDAGEWNGDEFISSGVLWEGTWSITFTEPGTYKYACLIHPRMVGTVKVET